MKLRIKLLKMFINKTLKKQFKILINNKISLEKFNQI